MTGTVKRQKFISRADLRANPQTIYVFGDNMVGKGFARQAKEMRGEPNAVGIPTKWYPSTNTDSYFTDDDLEKVAPRIDEAFIKLRLLQSQGYDIVFPEDGIGTGLAGLPSRAPKIYQHIQNWIARFF